MATSDLELRTKEAHVRGKIAWAQPADGSSPMFTMASSIDNGNAADAPLYFPHLLLPPPRCSGSIARSSRAISRTGTRSSWVRCGTFRSATAADYS